MEKHVKDIVRACTRDSDREIVSFGEVVLRLMQAGVERYHADLVRSEKTYYLPSGESELTPCAPVAGIIEQEFDGAAVETAIRSIQRGEIAYGEFCRHIARAGCVGYIVSLAGRRAVYYGRTADQHIEWFPGAR